MIVDTHTHPYLDEYSPDKTQSVSRAIESGVRMLIMPNVDTSTIKPMKMLNQAFPQNTLMAMGLHPTEIRENWQSELACIECELNSDTKYHAIGEIGIDLYWDATFKKEQLTALDTQLDWANHRNLPAIIHCRNGLSEVLDIIKSRRGLMPRIVFHSFGGDADDIKRIRSVCDPMFGINGIVTFKNSKLRDHLRLIGTDRLLLETDAPYLAPAPYRGRCNESAYITHIARHVADTLGEQPNELENITSANAAEFFNIIL